METFIDERIINSSKAIAFDLDWTLMWYIDGLYPRKDVRWMPGRIIKLTQLANNGWSFIVFTNQKKYNAERIRKAYEMLKLIAPCAIFAAVGDEFRKPGIKMYIKCKEMLPNCKIYTFVGDAAGRPQDFSNCDIGFAKAAKLRFMVPESVFEEKIPEVPADGKHVILLMGMPGSGKTTFYNKYLKNYIHINQDTLKTAAKVKKATATAMENNELICIDNTNGSAEKRKEIEDLAGMHGYTIHYWYLVRSGHTSNKLRDKPVPDIAYHMYFKNLSIPDSAVFI